MHRISPRFMSLPILLFLSASLMSAQAQSSAPAAPVPIQILSAKRVFVANGGEQRNLSGDLYFSGGPNRAYNQLYAAIKDWGRYEIVSAPADADLVLEIHLSDARNQAGYDELELTLLDPRTHTTLWTLSEHAVAAGRQRTRDAAFDRAMSLLTDDLKKLVAGPEAVPLGATKN